MPAVRWPGKLKTISLKSSLGSISPFCMLLNYLHVFLTFHMLGGEEPFFSGLLNYYKYVGA